MQTDHALLRLLQLSSVSLPVGAYSFSQGLEYAVEQGWVASQDDAYDWLLVQFENGFTHLDLAIVSRLYQALDDNDQHRVIEWNDYLLACRETHEFKLSDVAMGMALRRLLLKMDVEPIISSDDEASFVALFCIAAHQWQIDSRQCALGLAWSWLENQVAAATKLIPLGQTQAQSLLSDLQAVIPAAIDKAFAIEDEEIGFSLPALAIASSLHETQYTRLFRS